MSFGGTSPDIEIVIRAQNQASDVLNQVSKDMGQLENSAGRLTGVLASGLKTAAFVGVAAVGAVGAAAGAITIDAIGNAAELEDQLGNVAAVLRTTKGEIGEIKDLVMDLGLDPLLKVTTVEAAEAVEMLAKNGVEMADILDGATRSTILLANASGATFPVAADIATDVMFQFNKQGSEMESIVDGIIGVINQSKFDITDYSYAVRVAGGSFGAFGGEIEDLNTSLVQIAPTFQSGQVAGTAFRRMVTNLVPRSKKAGQAISELGLDFFDANGEMRSMAEITGELNRVFEGQSVVYREVGGRTAEQSDELTRLNKIYQRTATSISDYSAGIKGSTWEDEKRNKKLEELNATLVATESAMKPLLAIQGEMIQTTRTLTEEEKIRYIQTIFGERSMLAALALSKMTQQEFEDLSKSVNDTGQAYESATERVDDLVGAVEIFRSVKEAISLEIGEPFLEPLQEIVLDMAVLMRELGPALADSFLFEVPVNFLSDQIVPMIDNFRQQVESGEPFSLFGAIFDLGDGSLSIDVWDYISYDSTDSSRRIKVGDLIDWGTWTVPDSVKFTRISIGDIVEFNWSESLAGQDTSSKRFLISDLVDFSIDTIAGEITTKLSIGDFVDLKFRSSDLSVTKKLSVGEIFDFESFSLPAFGITKWKIGDLVDFSSFTDAEGEVRTLFSIGDLVNLDFASTDITTKFTVGDLIDFESFSLPAFEITKWQIGDLVDFSSFTDAEGEFRALFTVGDLVDFDFKSTDLLIKSKLAVGDIVDFTTLSLPDVDITKWNLGDLIDFSSAFSTEGGGQRLIKIGDIVDWDFSSVTGADITKISIADMIDFTSFGDLDIGATTLKLTAGDIETDLTFATTDGVLSVSLGDTTLELTGENVQNLANDMWLGVSAYLGDVFSGEQEMPVLEGLTTLRTDMIGAILDELTQFDPGLVTDFVVGSGGDFMIKVMGGILKGFDTVVQDTDIISSLGTTAADLVGTIFTVIGNAMGDPDNGEELGRGIVGTAGFVAVMAGLMAEAVISIGDAFIEELGDYDFERVQTQVDSFVASMVIGIGAGIAEADWSSIGVSIRDKLWEAIMGIGRLEPQSEVTPEEQQAAYIERSIGIELRGADTPEEIQERIEEMNPRRRASLGLTQERVAEQFNVTVPEIVFDDSISEIKEALGVPDPLRNEEDAEAGIWDTMKVGLAALFAPQIAGVETQLLALAGGGGDLTESFDRSKLLGAIAQNATDQTGQLGELASVTVESSEEQAILLTNVNRSMMGVEQSIQPQLGGFGTDQSDAVGVGGLGGLSDDPLNTDQFGGILSGFSWPTLPDIDWPELPDWKWPELPGINWGTPPEIEMEAPGRPGWIDELKSWVPPSPVGGLPAGRSTGPFALGGITGSRYVLAGEFGPEIIDMGTSRGMVYTAEETEELIERATNYREGPDSPVQEIAHLASGGQRPQSPERFALGGVTGSRYVLAGERGPEIIDMGTARGMVYTAEETETLMERAMSYREAQESPVQKISNLSPVGNRPQSPERFALGGKTSSRFVLAGEFGPEMIDTRGGRRGSYSDMGMNHSVEQVSEPAINVTINAAVANDIDMEKLAYRVADIANRRRSR